jgi:hypothetical protein
MALRQRYPINETDLLSDAPWRRRGLVDAVFKRGQDIPEEIKRQIGNLHVQLGTAIVDVARRIGDAEAAPVERSIAQAPLAAYHRKTATELVTAYKDANISVRALHIAVGAFRDLNQRIIERLAHGADDRVGEGDLLLANALLVYELSDFVIRYVEEFDLWGTQMIRSIRDRVNNSIEERERQDRKLKKEVKDPTVDAATRQRTLEQVALREQAVQRVRQEWEDLDRNLAASKDAPNPLKDRLPTLRIIRDNARAQIQMVNVLALTAAARDAMVCLDATIADVEGLELAPLTLERVERLLNVTV